MTTCGDYGGVKKNGEPCAIVTKDGRCGLHEEGVDLREKLLTPDEIEKVERMAEMALTVDEVAHVVGMHPDTFRARMRDQEGVALAYKSGRDKGHAWVKGQLRKQIQNGNTAATIFYLKTQCGWREKDRIEITGRDGGPVEYRAMSAEEKATRVAAMLAAAASRN